MNASRDTVDFGVERTVVESRMRYGRLRTDCLRRAGVDAIRAIRAMRGNLDAFAAVEADVMWSSRCDTHVLGEAASAF